MRLVFALAILHLGVVVLRDSLRRRRPHTCLSLCRSVYLWAVGLVGRGVGVGLGIVEGLRLRVHDLMALGLWVFCAA